MYHVTNYENIDFNVFKQKAHILHVDLEYYFFKV